MTRDPRAEHQRLVELLLEHSVQRGHFELSSGGTTDLYLDVRQTTLNAEGAAIVGRLILDRLRDDVVAVGGPTLGADPVACSAAAQSIAVAGRAIHGFLIRKEAKGHGTKRFIEGMSSIPAGSRVCVVEDTTTTGGSMLQAIERVVEAGYEVVQTICVVDRAEGARERFAEAGYSLDAIIERSELGT